MEKVKNTLNTIMEKIAGYKFIKVLQRAFAMVMPVLLIGSIFSLLVGLPVDAWTNFITNIGLYDYFTLVYNCTYGYYSLFVAFAFAYQYCSMSKQRKNAISAGLFAMVAFLITCNADSATYIGTMGILGAIIIGYFTGWLMTKLIEKNITIKLPDGVPPMVSQAFTAMIPGLAVCTLFMIISVLVGMTSYGNIQAMIYNLLRVPLTAVGANAVGEFVLVVYCQLMWFFGIHGGMVVLPIISVVFMEATMANLAAYTAGTTLPYMFVGTCLMGETYVLMALVVLLFSHRAELKQIAKVGIVPALFNISEPLVYGFPIVMNVNFFIPFVGTPIVGFIVTHLAQAIGFLGYSNCASITWTLPTTIQALFYYGWQGVVVNLIITAIMFVIWIPFVKLNDRALDKQDALAAESK